MSSSVCDAPISAVIDEPAIEPVLSSTMASSSPVAAVFAVDAAPTVTTPMFSTPSKVGLMVAVLVIWTLPDTSPGAGLYTIGAVTVAPKYPGYPPDIIALDVRLTLVQNILTPSADAPPVLM